MHQKFQDTSKYVRDVISYVQSGALAPYKILIFFAKSNIFYCASTVFHSFEPLQKQIGQCFAISKKKLILLLGRTVAHNLIIFLKYLKVRLGNLLLSVILKIILCRFMTLYKSLLSFFSLAVLFSVLSELQLPGIFLRIIFLSGPSLSSGFFPALKYQPITLIFKVLCQKLYKNFIQSHQLYANGLH